MNATFEKCRNDAHRKYVAERIAVPNREMAYWDHGFEDGYKSAIQSLEVTPELESAAREGWLNHACCNSGCASDDLLNAALKAFLSALKEQAK
jgi:hypothetical protein